MYADHLDSIFSGARTGNDSLFEELDYRAEFYEEWDQYRRYWQDDRMSLDEALGGLTIYNSYGEYILGRPEMYELDQELSQEILDLLDDLDVPVDQEIFGDTGELL